MERNEKLVEMLQEQMKVKGKDKTLIFVEQKKHADVLALFLCQEEIPSTTIHGNNSLLNYFIFVYTVVHQVIERRKNESKPWKTSKVGGNQFWWRLLWLPEV